jgi:predicted nucleotidyltransferase
METTKNTLPEDVQAFLNNLKHYLDKPLYFYGSIQRPDYMNGSDLDIDIFTDNETSTIEKLSHYLDRSNYNFKKTISKYNNDHNVIYGHKIMYISEELSLPIEFSIYNEKNKKQVLYQHNLKVDLPFYITFMLLVLKTIYYKLHLIEHTTYSNIKNTILTTCIGLKDNYFIKI